MGSAIELKLELTGYVPRHYAFAAWKNVLLARWAREATVEALRDLAVHWAALAQRHERFSYLCLIEGSAGLPTGDARDALRDVHDRFAAGSVCVAVALLGDGFWSSAHKGMITGIRQQATKRRPSELRMEPTTEALREWFVERHSAKSGVSISADEYDALVTALRAEASRIDAL